MVHPVGGGGKELGTESKDMDESQLRKRSGAGQGAKNGGGEVCFVLVLRSFGDQH